MTAFIFVRQIFHCLRNNHIIINTLQHNKYAHFLVIPIHPPHFLNCGCLTYAQSDVETCQGPPVQQLYRHSILCYESAEQEAL